MPTAHIIFQQNGDGYSTSSSRDNLVLSLPVTMLNQNDTGVVSWSWLMIDRPTGSAASIVSPSASTTTFTPDIVGTYLIHLSINSGLAQDQKGAAVKTANLQYRIPAASESIEFNSIRGWAAATNAALKTIDDAYMAPAAPPTLQSVYNSSNPSSFTLGSNGGFQIHDAFIPSGVNLFEIDTYSGGTKFITVSVAATSINNNLLVTGTNDIGVNTPTPLYPVHVTTSTNKYSFVQTRSTVTGGTYANSTSLGFGTSSNHQLIFFTNDLSGTPSMVVATSGAVGIGTASPTSQLDVVGTSHFTGVSTFDSGFTSSAASSVNSILNVSGLGTFQNHINVDGYAIDISGGASNGQALIYDGTSFVAQSVASGVGADTYNSLLNTTSSTPVVSFTPSSNGNFVCFMYYSVIVSATDVTIDITWTDATGAQTLTVLPLTNRLVGSYSILPVYIQNVASNPITVNFTAGTANKVYISASILIL